MKTLAFCLFCASTLVFVACDEKVDYFLIQRMWIAALQTQNLSVNTKLPVIHLLRKPKESLIFGSYDIKTKEIEIYLGEGFEEKMVYPIIGHELLHAAMDLKGVKGNHHCIMPKYLGVVLKVLNNQETTETALDWLMKQCFKDAGVHTEKIECYLPLPECNFRR